MGHWKNDRTKAIKKNNKLVKGKFCLTCGSAAVTPSHLLKTNAPYPGWDPAAEDSIFPQCWDCHSKFELLNPAGRVEYLESFGLFELAEIIRFYTGV